MTSKTLGLIASAALAIAFPLHADSISYTVGGTGAMQFPGPVTPPSNAPWGVNGYPGDTVELDGYTGSIDLVAGTSVHKIGTLFWTIDYTYAGTATDPDAWSDLNFLVTATRSMSIGSGTETIDQDGQLKVTWDNDYLSLGLGGTKTFLVPGYRIDVTPLALGEEGGSNFDGGNPWTQPSRDVFARVEITSVPDAGSTLGLMGAALIGLAAARPKARR